MFVVSEAEAAAIRAAFDHGGELAAAVELRRLFPGITDNPLAQDGANRNLPILEARPFRGVGGQFLDRHVERNIGQHQISAWIDASERKSGVS